MTDHTPKSRLARNNGDEDFALYLRWSAWINCHRTVPKLIEAVKRAVAGAGGPPMQFPTVSLCEPSLFPMWQTPPTRVSGTFRVRFLRV